MEVANRAGKLVRGAEDGTSRALSCNRPNMAKAALPHASTKLDWTSRRDVSLQAAASGSKASSSVRITAQNWEDMKKIRQRGEKKFNFQQQSMT